MRSRGLKLTLLAGLGVAAVAGLAAFQWKEIAARYHLARLRREPEHLRRILEEPEGSPERMAIRAYLENPRAREALLRILASSLCDGSLSGSMLEHEKTDVLLLRTDGLSVLSPVTLGTTQRLWMEVGVVSSDAPLTIMPSVAALLPKVKGQRFTLPEHADYRCSVVTGPEAMLLARIGGREVPEEPHYLLMERIVPPPWCDREGASD